MYRSLTRVYRAVSTPKPSSHNSLNGKCESSLSWPLTLSPGYTLTPSRFNRRGVMMDSSLIINQGITKHAVNDPSSDLLPMHLHRYLNFYLYTPLSALEQMRAILLAKWGRDLGVLGRVYLDQEGINAQVSVPQRNLDAFKKALKQMPVFARASLFEGDSVDTTDSKARAFDALHIRIRPLVMDGFGVSDLDMELTGTALSPKAWHELIEEKRRRDTSSSEEEKKSITVVDCRNYYESEIGRFDGAVRLPIEKHLDSFVHLDSLLAGKEEDKIMIVPSPSPADSFQEALSMAVSIAREDVNRLHGGINNYAQYIKQTSDSGLKPNFKGKNFVFDQRLDNNDRTVRVTSDKLASCHHCNVPEDDLHNCRNPTCNMLFVACEACRSKLEGCCSAECVHVVQMPKYHLKTLIAERRDGKRKRFASVERGDHPLLSQAKRGIHTSESMIVSSTVEAFSTEHSSPLDEYISSVRDITIQELGVDRSKNMITPLQAQTLKLLVRLARAERVLELGTFTGYSALALAEALPEHGKVITCENDGVLIELAKKIISKSSLRDKVEVRPGEAMETLLLFVKEKLLKEMIGDRKSGQFDFVFIDADKMRYLDYYHLILNRGLLRSQGLMVIDNVLWRGLVTDSNTTNKRAKIMQELCQTALNDERVNVLTLPVGDGFLVIQPK